MMMGGEEKREEEEKRRRRYTKKNQRDTEGVDTAHPMDLTRIQPQKQNRQQPNGNCAGNTTSHIEHLPGPSILGIYQHHAMPWWMDRQMDGWTIYYLWWKHLAYALLAPSASLFQKFTRVIITKHRGEGLGWAPLDAYVSVRLLRYMCPLRGLVNNRNI